MLFYADLHIHSKYSRATSKSSNLEELALWAKKKGLSVISTGDFTHPAWFEEITQKLVPCGSGVFRLKPEIEKEIFGGCKSLSGCEPVRFLLSVEISTIYKKWDKTRKVHHVVFMPDLASAKNFRQKLGAIGNIKSDGRPILGLDSRDLLEITLESGEGSCIIPAHIWTPWFSALGSKSGFDSIEDCYGDLSEHIFALETGLSSDPQMNWRVSKLDKYRLVSNSDAHSPQKLAREATVFDTEPDYLSIMNALKTGDGYVGTVEFFPEEGKYHEDGHRKCNVCLTPEETKELGGICPVCKKPMTIGVLNRVCELADRGPDSTFVPETAGKVFSLVPLAEIVSEIEGVGVQSKKVTFEYERLIQKFGSELSILMNVPLDELAKDSEILAEGIKRLREEKVIKQAGYDGEYGVIKLFSEDELVKKNSINLKLDLKIEKPSPANKTKKPFKSENPAVCAGIKTQIKPQQKSYSPDEFQQAAIENENGQLLIVAGPGSGKTTVLTRRIAYFINEKNISSENCLAITFTKRAAQEMRERLEKLLGEKCASINIHTFHSLCFSILKQNCDKAALDADFRVISPQEKALLKEKSIENTLEFDDLITLCIKLFKDCPDVLLNYQERFKYVFVDEYQDVDENQYKLIKLLVPKKGNICAIGDPNQAIYGFRGGDSRFFNSFSADYPDCQMVNLKNNYRSSGYIVNASNQLINSDNIISKCPINKEKIVIHNAATDNSEAEFAVSTIENLIGGHSFFSMDSGRSEGDECNYSFCDFAVLYRTSAQLEPVVKAFKRAGMPFVNPSDDLLISKKPVRKLLDTLDDNEPPHLAFKAVLAQFENEIEDYVLKYLENLSKTAASKDDFIHQVSLLKESDTLDKRADRISLMTLHSSKGLEFKCVFILGIEDGIIPLYRAKEEREKEEEKRLLYVGMTRAKERLYLCHANKRKWLGGYKNLSRSPFLTKIEADLLELQKFEREYKPKENVSQLSLF